MLSPRQYAWLLLLSAVWSFGFMSLVASLYFATH